MADTKISDLAHTATPATTAKIPLVDGGATKYSTVQEVVDAAGGGGGGGALSWSALPTLQNSWVDAGDTTAPKYAKEGNFVYLRGRITNGTTTDDTLLFTLPSGYRPPGDVFFISTTVTATAFGVVRINSDGTVKLFRGGLSNINLNGIVIPIT